MENCIVYKNEKATIEVTYGLYSEYKKGRPHYVLNLCQKASNELWEKCSTVVNHGLMHWSNKQLTNT